MSDVMVNVRNRGDKTYKEDYQGKTISIAPGSCVTMRKRDAIRFLGTISPMVGDSFAEKNLIIEQTEDDKPSETKNDYVCNFDGMKFPNQSALDEHSKIHADQLIVDKKAKK